MEIYDRLNLEEEAAKGEPLEETERWGGGTTIGEGMRVGSRLFFEHFEAAIAKILGD